MKQLFSIFAFCLFSTFLIAQNEFFEGQTTHSACHLHKHGAVEAAHFAGMAENGINYNSRSDTFDLLNFDLQLDVTDFANKKIYGAATIDWKAKMDGVAEIVFDLEGLATDGVWDAATGLALGFSALPKMLKITLPAPTVAGQTGSVRIKYRGSPLTCGCGFGGFYFEGGNAYNLGIGLTDVPPNNGRMWFPCFDSFRERATYDLHVRSRAPRKGYCSGDFLGETALGGDTILRNYRMNLPLPTYLLGIAVGDYRVVEQKYSGIYGDHPIQIVAKAADTTQAKGSLSRLNDAISAFEAWYGPYVWGAVGYVGTQRGAMEHSNLIAYPDFAFDGTQANNGLMAHELAHHWWGNITSPETPEDMWVKEGGAEYGAHLFVEKSFGRAAFETKIKDNTKFVLKNAHKDDGAYLALSPMPTPQTYGTHTYNKGALVYHNLRGYLGDSLYRHAMSAVLDSFHFEDLDAARYRDFLSAWTGKDLKPFFDAWIFAPGYSTFEIDSVKIENAEAEVFVEQKMYKAADFHQKVPLAITFWDAAQKKFDGQIEVAGQYGSGKIALPAGFQPVAWAQNQNQRLNTAVMHHTQTHKTTTTGLAAVPFADFNIRIWQLPAGDSALVYVAHHPAAPDKPASAPAGFHLSKSHFWRVDGVWPDGFWATASMQYNKSGDWLNDADLVSVTEDSLRLFWRPDAATAWQEHPFYTKQLIGGSTNGFGVIRVDSLLRGDYAFGNGELQPAVAVSEPSKNEAFELRIFPNPAADLVEAELFSDENTGWGLQLFDLSGRLVLEKTATSNRAKSLIINELAVGNYLLKAVDDRGRTLASKPFSKI